MRTAILSLLLLPVFAPAQSQPAPVLNAAATAVTGALNFRDIGGLRTSDGQIVRKGVLFRSGELSHLTPADFATFAALHLRYIFDLRTDAERAAAPTIWSQSGAPPVIIPLSVGFTHDANPVKQLFARGTDPAHVSEGMQAMTVQIALDGAPEIGRVLHDLANGDAPALIHCTAGKDRTGVTTAVLLRLLGVPQTTIEADYLLSNDAVPAQIARMRPAASAATPTAASPLAGLPPDSVKVLLGVDRSYITAAFAAINARYGSFDAYITQGLHLKQTDVEHLRTLLLEPSSQHL